MPASGVAICGLCSIRLRARAREAQAALLRFFGGDTTVRLPAFSFGLSESKR
jgi:hypothetical protein